MQAGYWLAIHMQQACSSLHVQIIGGDLPWSSNVFLSCTNGDRKPHPKSYHYPLTPLGEMIGNEERFSTSIAQQGFMYLIRDPTVTWQCFPVHVQKEVTLHTPQPERYHPLTPLGLPVKGDDRKRGKILTLVSPFHLILGEEACCGRWLRFLS